MAAAGGRQIGGATASLRGLRGGLLFYVTYVCYVVIFRSFETRPTLSVWT
jgi:hypothetical protein